MQGKRGGGRGGGRGVGRCESPGGREGRRALRSRWVTPSSAKVLGVPLSVLHIVVKACCTHSLTARAFVCGGGGNERTRVVCDAGVGGRVWKGDDYFWRIK